MYRIKLTSTSQYHWHAHLPMTTKAMMQHITSAATPTAMPTMAPIGKLLLLPPLEGGAGAMAGGWMGRGTEERREMLTPLTPQPCQEPIVMVLSYTDTPLACSGSSSSSRRVGL